MLTATVGTPMNRSELKHELGEWFFVTLVLVLGVVIVILHILHR